MDHSGCYQTPFGYLLIGSRADCVTSIRFVDHPNGINTPSPVTDLAACEILEYLSGKRKHFSFSINPDGTAFQRLVWHQLMQIPYGETRTYGQIAAIIGKPKAARAVGQAANRNPLWIAVPCHRMVGKNQELTGYAGGLRLKQALLELEQQNR